MLWYRKTPTSKSQSRPQYPYAQSKYFAEQLCLHWHKVYKLPVNLVRFSMLMVRDQGHLVLTGL